MLHVIMNTEMKNPVSCLTGNTQKTNFIMNENRASYKTLVSEYLGFVEVFFSIFGCNCNTSEAIFAHSYKVESES